PKGRVEIIRPSGAKSETGPRHARVPERWFKVLAGQSHGVKWLAVVLRLKHYQRYRKPFRCGDLSEYDIERNLKRDGLAILESLGLIEVARSDHRSPIVTVADT